MTISFVVCVIKIVSYLYFSSATEILFRGNAPGFILQAQGVFFPQGFFQIKFTERDKGVVSTRKPLPKGSSIWIFEFNLIRIKMQIETHINNVLSSPILFIREPCTI